MKTAKEWIQSISAPPTVNGITFAHLRTVDEADIAAIQKDAQDLPLLESALDHLSELECEWRWKQNEPRAGNQAQYETLAKLINQLQDVILQLKRNSP